MNVRFFKTPKTKRFEYVPRYFDPEEERKAELLKLKKTTDSSTNKKRIVFSKEVSYDSKSKNQQKLIAAIIRLGIAIAAVVAIFSYLNSAL